MANENNDISDIVKKCKILLLDIEGTTTSISFVKDKLFPYAEEHVKGFLENQWEEEAVKEVVTALRKLALEDHEKSVEGVVTIPGEEASKEDQIEGLVNNIKWQMSSDRKAGPLKLLQGLIWKQGYDKGDIKGHIYDDVSPALEQWHSIEGQKVYIYSSGSVQAQKLLFGQSSAGDLLPLIDGHFDTAVGSKQEADSYTAIAEKIGCKTEDILFLTDIVKEAEAARRSGVHVGLVSREGNAPLSAEATATYPVLHSFVQLTATNKRKPDETQDEQPAKVLKADVDDTVKTVENPQKPTLEDAETLLTATEEPEKMDVEEVVDTKESKKTETEEVFADKQAVIEEITEINETVVEQSVEATPIIIEVDTEKGKEMEVELPVIIESIEAPDQKIDEQSKEEKVSLAEETVLSIVTEIEDVSDEKQSLGEMVEIIEDLNPVIEEPEGVEDIDDLKNVGEVLEKECDEILSKVQNVTNLDSIPIKPLLHPIAEELMETENTDSNDIVDKILDTEMEMESKLCSDNQITTVQEVLETKVIAEGKETIADKDKPQMDATDKISMDNCKVNEISEDSNCKQIVVQKNPENKKEIKTVECQTETKMETVECQVNMDENIIDMQESKDEAKDSKTDTHKVDSKEMESGKQIITEKEIKVSKEEESISKIAYKTKDNEKIEEKEIQEVEKEKVLKENVDEISEKPEVSKVANKESATATEIEVAVSKESNSEEIKSENELKDTQINGNTTNGEVNVVDLNGVSKDEELKFWFSIETHRQADNESNGESARDQGQGDNKIETDVTDIKVKTVSADEPPNEPIEQPTEA